MNTRGENNLMFFKEDKNEYKIYDALDIARFIINYTNEEQNWVISNLKIQKVLYFLQAESIVSREVPLFNGKLIALSWGPCQEEVYNEFKFFGSAQIPTVKSFFKKNKILDKWQKITFSDDFLNINDKEMICTMLDYLKYYSANDLLQIIKNQTPWKESRYDHGDHIIRPDTLKKYFFSEEIDINERCKKR